MEGLPAPWAAALDETVTPIALRPLVQATERKIGKVKWFNSTKGAFGFG